MKRTLQTCLLLALFVLGVAAVQAAPCGSCQPCAGASRKPCQPPCAKLCTDRHGKLCTCKCGGCRLTPCSGAHGYGPFSPVRDRWVNTTSETFETLSLPAMTGARAPIVSYVTINEPCGVCWVALAERKVGWPAAAGGTNGAYTVYYIAYPVKARGATIPFGMKPRRVMRDLRPGYCPTLWRFETCQQ